MTDVTLEVEKTPEELEAARIQAEADVAEWFRQSEQLRTLKETEMELRNKVVQYYFPNGLKEGTNKTEVREGWTLNVKGVVNRKVDVAAESAVREALKELEVDLGDFLRYKPELAITEYRTLCESVEKSSGAEQERNKKIKELVHQLLIVTDGSPGVELVPPKKPKAKVTAA